MVSMDMRSVSELPPPPKAATIMRSPIVMGSSLLGILTEITPSWHGRNREPIAMIWVMILLPSMVCRADGARACLIRWSSVCSL
jgi:hypothetical protein